MEIDDRDTNTVQIPTNNLKKSSFLQNHDPGNQNSFTETISSSQEEMSKFEEISGAFSLEKIAEISENFIQQTEEFNAEFFFNAGESDGFLKKIYDYDDVSEDDLSSDSNQSFDQEPEFKEEKDKISSEEDAFSPFQLLGGSWKNSEDDNFDFVRSLKECAEVKNPYGYEGRERSVTPGECIEDAHATFGIHDVKPYHEFMLSVDVPTKHFPAEGTHSQLENFTEKEQNLQYIQGVSIGVNHSYEALDTKLKDNRLGFFNNAPTDDLKTSRAISPDITLTQDDLDLKETEKSARNIQFFPRKERDSIVNYSAESNNFFQAKNDEATTPRTSSNFSLYSNYGPSLSTSMQFLKNIPQAGWSLLGQRNDNESETVFSYLNATENSALHDKTANYNTSSVKMYTAIYGPTAETQKVAYDATSVAIEYRTAYNEEIGANNLSDATTNFHPGSTKSNVVIPSEITPNSTSEGTHSSFVSQRNNINLKNQYYNLQKPKTPFNIFIELLKHPSCAPTVAQIRTFVSEFPRNSDYTVSKKLLLPFISNVENLLLQTQAFSGYSEDEERGESVVDSVEKFVVKKLYDRLFGCNEDDLKEDNRISNLLRSLSWVKLKHLDFFIEINEAQLSIATRELDLLACLKAPRDKIILIINCCRAIISILEESFKERNASYTAPSNDDILPVLIYTIIKSNPPHLRSQIQFIQAFRHPTRLVKQEEYYFIQFSSAVEFISGLGSKTKLNITDEEYTRIAAGLASSEDLEALRYLVKSELPDNIDNTIEDSLSSILPREYAKAETSTQDAYSEIKFGDKKASILNNLVKVSQGITTSYESYSSIHEIKVGNLNSLLSEYQQLVKFKKIFDSTILTLGLIDS